MKQIATYDGELILDGSKIAYHADRVAQWDAGERIAPVSVDLALTRACQSSCRGCYAVLQESQERENITEKHALNLLDDFADIGVRGVSIVSDGESTLSPAYVPFIQHAAEVGIDIGNATNGWRFFPDVAEQVMPHMKWIRFTVLSGTADGFMRMMAPHDKTYKQWANMMVNVAHAVQFKRARNLDITLGIQTFVTPEDEAEIVAFAQLGIDLGVDYAVIKHTSDDEYGSFGIHYEDYGKISDALKRAEAMSTDTTKVIVKWNKIADGNRPPYKRFYAPPFLLQLSGSGLVAPSGMFFNSRYSRLHIGSFVDERFKDIWQSSRYWDVMQYLTSPMFDAETMLGALPIQHYTNVALDRHVRGIDRIEPLPDGTPVPAHVSFL